MHPKDTKTPSAWIGFDIEKYDFVKPHGQGEVADMEIKYEFDGHDLNNIDGMDVYMRFPSQAQSPAHVCIREATGSDMVITLRAPREVARMEVPARGMRRLADGVRAADGMTALAFAAKHTPKTLRSPQKRARPSEGSVAFPKGGDIPAALRLVPSRRIW